MAVALNSLAMNSLDHTRAPASAGSASPSTGGRNQAQAAGKGKGLDLFADLFESALDRDNSRSGPPASVPLHDRTAASRGMAQSEGHDSSLAIKAHPKRAQIGPEAEGRASSRRPGRAKASAEPTKESPVLLPQEKPVAQGGGASKKKALAEDKTEEFLEPRQPGVDPIVNLGDDQSRSAVRSADSQPVAETLPLESGEPTPWPQVETAAGIVGSEVAPPAALVLPAVIPVAAQAAVPSEIAKVVLEALMAGSAASESTNRPGTAVAATGVLTAVEGLGTPKVQEPPRLVPSHEPAVPVAGDQVSVPATAGSQAGQPPFGVVEDAIPVPATAGVPPANSIEMIDPGAGEPDRFVLDPAAGWQAVKPKPTSFLEGTPLTPAPSFGAVAAKGPEENPEQRPQSVSSSGPSVPAETADSNRGRLETAPASAFQAKVESEPPKPVEVASMGTDPHSVLGGSTGELKKAEPKTSPSVPDTKEPSTVSSHPRSPIGRGWGERSSISGLSPKPVSASAPEPAIPEAVPKSEAPPESLGIDRLGSNPAVMANPSRNGSIPEGPAAFPTVLQAEPGPLPIAAETVMVESAAAEAFEPDPAGPVPLPNAKPLVVGKATSQPLAEESKAPVVSGPLMPRIEEDFSPAAAKPMSPEKLSPLSVVQGKPSEKILFQSAPGDLSIPIGGQEASSGEAAELLDGGMPNAVPPPASPMQNLEVADAFLADAGQHQAEKPIVLKAENQQALSDPELKLSGAPTAEPLEDQEKQEAPRAGFNAQAPQRQGREPAQNSGPLPVPVETATPKGPTAGPPPARSPLGPSDTVPEPVAERPESSREGTPPKMEGTSMPSPGKDTLPLPPTAAAFQKPQASAKPLEPVLNSVGPADPPSTLPVPPVSGFKPEPRPAEKGLALPAETSAELEESPIAGLPQGEGLPDSGAAAVAAESEEDFGFSPALDNLIWETGQRRQAEAAHPAQPRSAASGVRFTGEVNRRLAQMEAFHNGQPMVRLPQDRAAGMGGKAPVFGSGLAAKTEGHQETVARVRELLSAAALQGREPAMDQVASSVKSSHSSVLTNGGGQSEAIPLATATVAPATDPIRPAVPPSQTSQEAVAAPEEAGFGQKGSSSEQRFTGGGQHRESTPHPMTPVSLVHGTGGSAESPRGVPFPRVGVPLSSQQLDQLADQVAGKLARVATNGTVVVPLDPPELGRVLARFVRRGEELKVQLVAESVEAASALTKEIGRLQSALGKPGEPVRVEVQVAGDGFQRSGQGQTQGQSQAREEAPLPRWVYGSGNGSRAEAPVLPMERAFASSKSSGLNILT